MNLIAAIAYIHTFHSKGRTIQGIEYEDGSGLNFNVRWAEEEKPEFISLHVNAQEWRDNFSSGFSLLEDRQGMADYLRSTAHRYEHDAHVVNNFEYAHHAFSQEVRTISINNGPLGELMKLVRDAITSLLSHQASSQNRRIAIIEDLTKPEGNNNEQ